MASPIVDILLTLGPLLAFIVLMVVVYFRGNRQNKQLLNELESDIKSALDPYTTQIRKVQIRPDEYEFRCKPSSNEVNVLTFHLKLVNRSFIIQWLINLVFKEDERIFIGAKFAGEYGDEDPPYKFDVVPYRNKGFIKRRHENFVKYDDIPTLDKSVDNDFMIKSESEAYVEHLVRNSEFVRLLKENEPYLEHFGLQSSKEKTDPHISATYEFRGLEERPVKQFIDMFFLGVNLHLKNRDNVKKLVRKGKRGRARAKSRGRAKRGVATRRRRKKK